MEELKPCPFCGGNGNLKRVYGIGGFAFVECLECGAISSPAEGDEEAIAAWNDRYERSDTCEGCVILNRDYGHAPSPCNFCARNDKDRYDLYTPAKVVG